MNPQNQNQNHIDSHSLSALSQSSLSPNMNSTSEHSRSMSIPGQGPDERDGERNQDKSEVENTQRAEGNTNISGVSFNPKTSTQTEGETLLVSLDREKEIEVPPNNNNSYNNVNVTTVSQNNQSHTQSYSYDTYSKKQLIQALGEEDVKAYLCCDGRGLSLDSYSPSPFLPSAANSNNKSNTKETYNLSSTNPILSGLYRNMVRCLSILAQLEVISRYRKPSGSTNISVPVNSSSESNNGMKKLNSTQEREDSNVINSSRNSVSQNESSVHETSRSEMEKDNIDNAIDKTIENLSFNDNDNNNVNSISEDLKRLGADDSKKAKSNRNLIEYEPTILIETTKQNIIVKEYDGMTIVASQQTN